MKNKIFQFEFNDLKLTTSDIEAVMGYKKGDDRVLVTALIDEILSESQHIRNIKAQYSVFDDVLFNNVNKSVSINGIVFHVKNIVFTQIKKSDSVALFLCTAGKEIGIRSRKAMQERDFLKGYIYDVVGSEIVEAATDIMQEELGKSVSVSGHKITNRYSPGYCGWDVAEQHLLFRFFPDNYCGIQLTSSALMDPVKSVSGIIGTGENVKSNPYTCRMCNMKECAYRRSHESKNNSYI